MPTSFLNALRFSLALFALSTSLTPAAHAQDAAAGARSMRMLAGAQQEIRPGPALERVAVSNPAVADALLLKHRSGPPSVLVVAKSPGVTDLMIWSGGAPVSYSVQVDAVSPDRGGADVSISTAGATISGQSPDAAAAARAQRAARMATSAGKAADGKGGLIVDRSTVPVSGTVQVDVKVMEISKTIIKEVGLNFVKQNGGFAFGSFSPTTISKITPSPQGMDIEGTVPIASAFNLLAASASRGLFANLSILEANGLVRVLAEPTLVTLSGQSASFLAGGEIPIPVPQALGTTTIQFKPFGIGLTVSPTVISSQRIALKVAPEASDLDPSRGIQINGASVPAIVTRRADTMIELGDGESFVIGGLVSRNTVSNVNKVPFLGDLPIIGAFFKNLNFHQEDRELVIIVTPHLVKPMAKDAPAIAAVGNDGTTRTNPNVWGRFIAGEYVDPTLPGFSR
ncbi:type II and III secretion system protein family protein [Cupriavidus plantarum]|uniref:type II and III secretion system protein family protein n=1 Tax=Cupriavidus plantarum TaxID=942865 RepID=UPI000E2460FC|nr:type II and III secretion system protein family protein [Cupriavidus plantarum]REE94183.1 pilus assembly protein CpaC [Cupriavidus plantarum]CAG2154315.1 Type 3 secretion system secretin [Cupriavidus plantarum]SMR86813.1 pilus assembly protein CpaC [Cupriavidus plantarum]